MEGENTVCFICRKLITEDDCDISKNNRAMKMMGVPGYVHRKCKIDSGSFFIGTSYGQTDLTNEIKKL